MHDLLKDERHQPSSARVGMWSTFALIVLTIARDVLTPPSWEHVSNAIFSLEGTMFMAFTAWAAGPRIAQYLGPQIGQIASGIASAVRDVRLPNNKTDNEVGPSPSYGN